MRGTWDTDGYAGTECYDDELTFRRDLMSEFNAERVMAINQFSRGEKDIPVLRDVLFSLYRLAEKDAIQTRLCSLYKPPCLRWGRR